MFKCFSFVYSEFLESLWVPCRAPSQGEEPVWPWPRQAMATPGSVDNKFCGNYQWAPQGICINLAIQLYYNKIAILQLYSYNLAIQLYYSYIAILQLYSFLEPKCQKLNQNAKILENHIKIYLNSKKLSFQAPVAHVTPSFT